MDGLTLALAIYGAIVSTSTALWNVYAWRGRDRRVKVRSRFATAYLGDNRRQADYLSIEVANIGGRPMTFEAFGWVVGGGRVAQVNPQAWQVGDFPKRLEEGASYSFMAERRPLVRSRSGYTLKSPPKRAYAKDGTGKIYQARLSTAIRDILWGDATYRPWYKFWQQGWWRL